MDKNVIHELIALRHKQSKHVAALVRIDARICELATKLACDCHAAGLIDDETAALAAAPKTRPEDD